MTVSPGFTAAEIRDFVLDYQSLPMGQKRIWLAERGVGYHKLRRWRSAVFEGDPDRGLIPRKGSDTTIPPDKRTALAKLRAEERDDHAAEIAKLSGRVRELEETNTALGKAIGLLHAMTEEEPATPPMTPDSSSS
jgi:hypothetical protein